MMNPNPSGLDPTARSFTGQFAQNQNQANVYGMSGTVPSLQHLQSSLANRPNFGAATGGAGGGMPVSGAAQGLDRFQPNPAAAAAAAANYTQFQQQQSRHPGLTLGGAAAGSFSANPAANVRNQQYSTQQLGLQSASLANRPLMNTGMGIPGFGVNTGSQNLSGLPTLQQWPGTGQQQLNPGNLHSLSMSRMAGMSPQQHQLAQVRSMNPLTGAGGGAGARDLSSQAVGLTSMLQQQQTAANPSQDLLSIMRSSQQRNAQYPHGLMPQVPSAGRSALTLERPSEVGISTSSVNSLKFETPDFPALSEVGAAAARANALTLTEAETDKKEEFPTLSSTMDSGNARTISNAILKTPQPPPPSQTISSPPGPDSGNPVQSSGSLTAQSYFQGGHNIQAVVQDSLNALQAAGRSVRSPPTALVTPGGAQHDRFSLLGLNMVIRRVEEDLSMLALGQDLTLLGLKLDDSGSELYKTFISPWADHQMPGKTAEFEIPGSYKGLNEKLRPEHLAKFKDETLFYVFYSSPGEEAQALAGAVLAQRGLSWHKDYKQWFVRVPNQTVQKIADGERGSYLFFDTSEWKYIQRDNFSVKYDAVESGANLIRAHQIPVAIK